MHGTLPRSMDREKPGDGTGEGLRGTDIGTGDAQNHTYSSPKVQDNLDDARHSDENRKEEIGLPRMQRADYPFLEETTSIPDSFLRWNELTIDSDCIKRLYSGAKPAKITELLRLLKGRGFDSYDYGLVTEELEDHCKEMNVTIKQYVGFFLVPRHASRFNQYANEEEWWEVSRDNWALSFVGVDGFVYEYKPNTGIVKRPLVWEETNPADLSKALCRDLLI